MQNKKSEEGQEYLFYQRLEYLLNPENPLYQLSHKIPWEKLEKEFVKYYVDFGRPAKPTRLMISLLLLKQLYNKGDETVVEEWVQNPYWQYLSGEEVFKWEFPCDPSDLVHFRKRIGEEGMEKIFQMTIEMHKEKETGESEIVVDTTVQEKNITYPTDTKLHSKIASQCVEIARREGIKLRRSYKRTIKKLLYAQRGRNNPRTFKKAVKAGKKIKTHAGCLVRELERKLPEEILGKYRENLELFKKVLSQKRSDKNKIYSLHEPEVCCISKGKAHKKYEFGSKASIGVTKNSGIIVSAINFQTNPYDGKTLPEVIKDVEKRIGKIPKAIIVDQGYRGKRKIGETEIISADKFKRKLSEYERKKTKKQLRRRSGIEGIIGHLKEDFRLARNYLKGVIGDSINLLLAAAAFNIRKWLRNTAFFIFYILMISLNFGLPQHQKLENQTF